MNVPEFFLNNVLINPPKNWRELSLELNYEDGEFKSQQVLINDWDFVRENIDIINAWITNGFIFEGIPFRITQLNDVGATDIIFNGYIDLTNEAKFGEYGITAKATPQYSVDWLNDVATGFSIEYLHEIGLINSTDFVDIPYVISAIPDYKSAVIAVIGFTLIINDLSASIVSLGAAIDAVLSGTFDWAEIITLVGEILKFTVLVIASIKLLKRIVFLLMQRVKYHKGIKTRTIFEKGCQYLGLQFQSTIIPDYEYILPKKYVVPKNPQNLYNYGVLGSFSPNEFPQVGFPDGTFADFIIKQKEKFNGKILFNNNVMMFERVDYSTAVPTYQLPNIINDKFTLNTNDFKSNFVISYETDVRESNTITNYLGTSYQAILKVTTLANPTLNYGLAKGLTQINNSYALGKRKNELTNIEEIVKDLLNILDTLIAGAAFLVNNLVSVINGVMNALENFIQFIANVGDVFGFEFDVPDFATIPKFDPIDLSNIIENRVGMLLLENDSFMVDKVLWLDSEYKLMTTQPTAKNDYHLYYEIDHFTQYKNKDWNQIPFTMNDFNEVKNNPRALTPDGNLAKLVSVKFNVWNKIADISTKEHYIYTHNLNKTFIEPNGE